MIWEKGPPGGRRRDGGKMVGLTLTQGALLLELLAATFPWTYPRRLVGVGAHVLR